MIICFTHFRHEINGFYYGINIYLQFTYIQHQAICHQIYLGFNKKKENSKKIILLNNLNKFVTI